MMKHLPIGKLIETIKDNKKTYTLRLFNDAVVETFDNIPDALELVAKHGEAVIKKHAILEEISVVIKHNDGRKHYLLMDMLGEAKGLDVRVYEETEYEYITSHATFKKLSSRRRKINERKYDFNDVLRSGINWSPWFTWIFGTLLTLLIIAGASTLISFFDMIDSSTDLTSWQMLTFYMGSISTLVSAFIVPIIHLLVFYINKKVLKENDFEYGRLNWRRWYKWRMYSLIFCLLLYITTIYFDIQLLINLWDMDGIIEKLVIANTFIVLGLISFATIAVLYVVFYIGSYKLFRNLRIYFNKDERLFFWRWYRGKTEQMAVKIDYDFFIFNPEDTVYVARSEMKEATMLVQKLSNEELNELKSKTKYFHKMGVKKYAKLLNTGILEELT